MRRAVLLALLAAPAVASAQATPAPGTITFDDLQRSSTDGFINRDECSGSQTIALDWAIGLGTTTGGFPSSMDFTLFASNKDTTGDCPVADGDKGDTSLLARSVGATLSNRADEFEFDVAFSTSAIAQAAGKGACTATADEEIFLCVQARDSNQNKVGTARGRLILSLAQPDAPGSLSASPGDHALNLDWPEVTTGPEVEYYEVTATSFVDPTNLTSLDPRDPQPHSAQFDVPRDARLNGLVNDVQYVLRIHSFSRADNRSATFAETTGMPQPVDDFWESYLRAGGREEGGCAGGRAGAISLLIAAGLLAAVRRRR